MTSAAAKRPTDADHLGNSYSPDLNGHRDLSVFSIDVHWRRSAQPLPSIYITEPTLESQAIEHTQALYTTPYGGRFPMLLFPEESPQPVGESACFFGDSYYHEGMRTSAQDNLGKRIDCFRSSELLYLHAAARGSVRAHTGLGNIYLADRCEGHYFEACGANLLADRVLPKEQIEKKAHDHLLFAAQHGEVEGTYLYGDVLRQGVGCEADAAAAFDHYRLAYERTEAMYVPTAVVWGNVTLRLGRAYEEGWGCKPDFSRALGYYERACEYLEDSVDRGAWHYRAQLGEALRGVRRMKQVRTLRGEGAPA